MSESHGNTEMHRKHHEHREMDIREIIEMIVANKWFVLLTVIFAIIVGWVYTFTIPTQYQSTALIQIENKSQGIPGVSNVSATGLILGGAGSSRNTSTGTEIALMKSRFVLQPTVESLGLDVIVAPHYFPILSKVFIHFHKSEKITPPFLGINHYVWGGERINVKQFKVPPQFFNHAFTVVVKEAGDYEIYTETKKILLQGKVGEMAESSATSIIPGVKILITELNANVGTEFILVQQPSVDVAQEMSGNLTATDIGIGLSEAGVTGIFNIMLKGTNQWLLPTILNTLIAYDIQMNVDKKNIEVQKTLEFLKQQAPIVKTSLDQAETVLGDFKAEYGFGGVNSNNNVFFNKLVTIGKTIEEIKLKKGELLQSFTEKHPLIVTLNQQQKRLEQELLFLEKKLNTFPKTDRKVLSIARDIKVKEQLYMLILGKIQELQITQAGIIGDIRMLTPATSATELPSKQLVTITAAALFGWFLAIAFIFIRKVLTRGVEDPDYVEDYLGIPTYAILPYSREQKKLAREVKRNIHGTGPFVLATSKPKDLTVEGLRSLRTTLQFSLQEANSNIMTVLGTSPGIGKSFISVNLAQLFADSGKSVLLIDADIRKGRMHLYLECKKSLGLAELLSGSNEFDEVRNKITDRFDFVACGESTGPSPVELFLSGKFQEFVLNISDLYDIIVIDTPPILAVAEGVVIAQKISSVNVLLIGVGTDDLSGVERAAKILHKNGVKINGLVFNSVTRTKNSHGYGNYGYYSNEK